MCIYDICMPTVLNVDSDDRLPGLHHIMDMWTWASFLTSSYLRFLICKMGMMIIFTSWGLLKSELFNTCKMHRKVSGVSKTFSHLFIVVVEIC